MFFKLSFTFQTDLFLKKLQTVEGLKSNLRASILRMNETKPKYFKQSKLQVSKLAFSFPAEIQLPKPKWIKKTNTMKPLGSLMIVE